MFVFSLKAFRNKENILKFLESLNYMLLAHLADQSAEYGHFQKVLRVPNQNCRFASMN